MESGGALDWKECTEPLHAAVQDCTRALLQLYRSQPALYEEDFSADGFEWIDNLDWQRNLLIFLRKSRDGKNTLLAVCNFSNVEYDDFRVGVPKAGKYKEIFNSDALAFGGSGAVNPRVKASRPVEAHERGKFYQGKNSAFGEFLFCPSGKTDEGQRRRRGKGRAFLQFSRHLRRKNLHLQARYGRVVKMNS